MVDIAPSPALQERPGESVCHVDNVVGQFHCIILSFVWFLFGLMMDIVNIFRSKPREIIGYFLEICRFISRGK
jgi:hypothetical protein